MKKILSLLFLSLLSFGVFAQSTLFLRASTVTLGFREDVGTDIIWGETKPVNVLIKVEQTKVTVFSQQTQEYHLVGVIEKTEDGTKYRCSNVEGKLCNLIVMRVPDSPGYIFFVIEFSDTVWYYKCKVE